MSEKPYNPAEALVVKTSAAQSIIPDVSVLSIDIGFGLASPFGDFGYLHGNLQQVLQHGESILVEVMIFQTFQINTQCGAG